MSNYQEESNALIPGGGDEEEPMQMTLGGMGMGEGEKDDELYPGAVETNGGGLLSNTTLILVAVVLIAGGSLYAMRAMKSSLDSDGDLKEIEAKIESTLSRLNSPGLLPDGDPLLAENLSTLLMPTDDMTAIFEHDVREQQVPIEKVKKDPFSLTLSDSVLEVTNDAGRETSMSKKLEKYRKELGGYELQSIMLGSRNIAVIGGEFYKRGDRLGSFNVTGIDKFTVYLEAEGMPFELSLQTGGR